MKNQKLTRQQKLFIKDCQRKGISESVVRRGFKSGLSIEQVSIFAQKYFDSGQMSWICLSMESKKPMQFVTTIAKPSISASQMYQLSKAFESGSALEQIQTKVSLLILEK